MDTASRQGGFSSINSELLADELAVSRQQSVKGSLGKSAAIRKNPQAKTPRPPVRSRAIHRTFPIL